MRFVTIAFLAGVLLPASAAAQENIERKVDQVFAAYNKADSPGCALGVVRDGNFVLRKAYGAASLELGVPLSPASVFYMGSVSKQFTAASVVLAAEQGFLSLDDDVRKYIPELPDYGHPITLRQMLHHTSGFRDFLTLLDLSDLDAGTIHSSQEIVNLIARQKGLNNIPGDEYLYSNTNYFLLGEVIKRATGKTLAEFAESNIFRPVGMAHTRFYDDHTLVVPGRVAAYDPGAKSGFLVDWSTGYDIVGAGGLMSSVDDLLLWDRNFYSNKLGKGTLVKELETRGVLNNGKTIGYALGLEIGTYRGLPTVAHDGALYGYRTAILRFPEQRFSVVCLCNLSTSNPDALARKVADVYLEKDLQPEPKAAGVASEGPSPDANLFAGRYLDPRDHSIYSITASGAGLKLGGMVLRRMGPNRFQGGSVSLTFDGAGSGMAANIEVNGEPFFTGRKVAEPHLSDADLSSYAGSYKSSEIDGTYKLSVSEGSMEVRIGWNPPVKLTPIAADEFQSDEIGTFVFHRGTDHRISGFALFSGRARNIAFGKTQ